MKQKPLDLTILIPCLNEASTIGNVIKDAAKTIKKLKLQGEILVVDNESRDLSKYIAKQNGARVISCQKKGYGNALTYGIQQAYGIYILMLDADGSYNPLSLPQLWEKLHDEQCDMVIGSRLSGSIQTGAMPFLHRYVGTPMLTHVLNFFFEMRIRDCNSGMRLFKRTTIVKLHLTSAGMEYASEMLVKAGILKLKVCDIPITYYKNKRRTQRTNLRTWRDGWRHLKVLFSYAPHYFFILPGILLFISGTFLVITQYTGPFTFGKIYLDIHLMILGVFLGFLGSGLLQMGIVLEKDAWQNGYPVGWLFKLIRFHFTPERGCLLGISIFFIGILLDTNIVFIWIKHNFSNIYEVRKAITATYIMYLGFQFLFFSFFLDFIARDK